MTEQEYDFYFSAKHKEVQVRIKDRRGRKYITTFFKGKEYTEMIEKGKTPITNWAGDLVKLGTGTVKDIHR